MTGIWSAETRTQGGLGAQYVFSADGRVTYVFGALIDFTYELADSEVTTVVIGPSGAPIGAPTVQTFTISEDGSELTLQDTRTGGVRAMVRVGDPDPSRHLIIGDWTYVHDTGTPAVQRYTGEGTGQLSVPFEVIEGTYSATNGSYSISLTGSDVLQAELAAGEPGVLIVRETSDKRYRKLAD
jgi:hypothetical protein